MSKNGQLARAGSGARGDHRVVWPVDQGRKTRAAPVVEVRRHDGAHLEPLPQLRSEHGIVPKTALHGAHVRLRSHALGNLVIAPEPTAAHNAPEAMGAAHIAEGAVERRANATSPRRRMHVDIRKVERVASRSVRAEAPAIRDVDPRMWRESRELGNNERRDGADDASSIYGDTLPGAKRPNLLLQLPCLVDNTGGHKIWVSGVIQCLECDDVVLRSAANDEAHGHKRRDGTPRRQGDPRTCCQAVLALSHPGDGATTNKELGAREPRGREVVHETADMRALGL